MTTVVAMDFEWVDGWVALKVVRTVVEKVAWSAKVWVYITAE